MKAYRVERSVGREAPHWQHVRRPLLPSELASACQGFRCLRPAAAPAPSGRPTPAREPEPIARLAAYSSGQPCFYPVAAPTGLKPAPSELPLERLVVKVQRLQGPASCPASVPSEQPPTTPWCRRLATQGLFSLHWSAPASHSSAPESQDVAATIAGSAPAHPAAGLVPPKAPGARKIVGIDFVTDISRDRRQGYSRDITHFGLLGNSSISASSRRTSASLCSLTRRCCRSVYLLCLRCRPRYSRRCW